MSSIATPSTRRLRACTECARRKIRCDQSTPCFACLQRGTGCSRFPASPADSEVLGQRDHEAELSKYRERIAQLEAELAHARHINIPKPNTIMNNRGLPRNEHEDSNGAPPHQNSLPEIDDLQTSIENLNLGISQDQQSQQTRPFFGTSLPQPFQSYLPSRFLSTELVNFSISQLSWIHCALQATAFLQQHEQFWAAIENGDCTVFARHSWLANYYAVLATAVYYIDESHACFPELSVLFMDTQSCDGTTYATKWYRAALEHLHALDYMEKPRLSTIQTIAILTLLNASLGQNDRGLMMIGVAINMARCLLMDRLGTKDSYTKTVERIPAWHTVKGRSLGRRLWWTLVICDWLGSMTYPATIAPSSFDTDIDVDDDSDVIPIPQMVVGNGDPAPFSSLHYHLAMAKLARVIQTYIKGGRGYSQSNVADAMREVESIYETCPLFNSDVTKLETESHCSGQNVAFWIFFQRYLFTHTYQFIRLTIVRVNFSLWLHRQPDQHNFHRKALDAAEAIVKEKHRVVPQMYRKSWIVCASTVAAGVFLCLDLLCFGTGQDELQRNNRRDSIRACISALESLKSANIISRRGPATLKRLLDLEETWNYKHVPDKEEVKLIVRYATASDVGAETVGMESLLPQYPDISIWQNTTFQPTAYPTFNARDHDSMDCDAVGDIISSVVNELGSFENPFEFDDNSFY